MTDKEKFEGFKRKLVSENEEKYGKEIRQKYGDKVINESNEKILHISEGQLDRVTHLAEEILETLNLAYHTGDPAGELAQKAASLHKEWLCCYWNQYAKEAHAGLAQMYVDDPRFTSYYDAKQPGTAEFFRKAILFFTAQA